MTTVYVPGLGEKDPDKIIRSLQQIGPRLATAEDGITTNTTAIAAMKAAWTAYTPAVTSSVGTLTTKSAVGRYLTVGKTTYFSLTATITTNGTGSVSIDCTLPNTVAAAIQTVSGVSSLGGSLVAYLGSGATTIKLFNYDGTYPGADGRMLTASGVYENA